MKEKDCQAIFALLSEYLDGQLPPATCEELEGHIRDCPPCVAFVNSLKKSVNLCRDYSSTAEPPPLDPHVKEQLRKSYQRLHQK
jgi:RNA polymerase sigma-70 factor (ECF subfamily)